MNDRYIINQHPESADSVDLIVFATPTHRSFASGKTGRDLPISLQIEGDELTAFSLAEIVQLIAALEDLLVKAARTAA